ncbi:hypothetical protein MAR_011308 [Mya arenaria]|uniref:Uncharacterized protein n=1 Tax=Mya arenaria TaxID=6604 RepID=A0ABY7FWF8_MYAAR|nr:hypothetical protein MAR_011308 [Mya arenaria]
MAEVSRGEEEDVLDIGDNRYVVEDNRCGQRGRRRLLSTDSSECESEQMLLLSEYEDSDIHYRSSSENELQSPSQHKTGMTGRLSNGSENDESEEPEDLNINEDQTMSRYSMDVQFSDLDTSLMDASVTILIRFEHVTGPPDVDTTTPRLVSVQDITSLVSNELVAAPKDMEITTHEDPRFVRACCKTADGDNSCPSLVHGPVSDLHSPLETANGDTSCSSLVDEPDGALPLPLETADGDISCPSLVHAPDGALPLPLETTDRDYFVSQLGPCARWCLTFTIRDN